MLARSCSLLAQAVVGPAAESALRSSFASTLVPGYERASKAMFESLHATFEQVALYYK